MKNIILHKHIVWDNNLNLQYKISYPILSVIKHLLFDIWNELVQYRNKCKEIPEPLPQVNAELNIIKQSYIKVKNSINSCISIDQLDSADEAIHIFERVYRHKQFTQHLWKISLSKRKLLNDI